MSAKAAPRLKLQIVSDLHLEFRPNDLDFIIPSAPVLCLLGDICVLGTTEDFETYKRFISTIYDKFALIIHVPGNHEYYTNTPRGKEAACPIEKINARLKAYSKSRPKLCVLINNMLKLKIAKTSYYIIGSTLWTYVNPQDYKSIQSSMNDYNCITVLNRETGTPRPYRVEDMQKLHKRCVACIKKFTAIAKQDQAKCILLTHHKAFRDKLHPRSQAYESDLAELFVNPIVLAAYGHTHKKFNGTVNGVRTVSNPRGYPGERTMFSPKFTVTV
jgi:hypothetical protein